jgi:hypothetical protein
MAVSGHPVRCRTVRPHLGPMILVSLPWLSVRSRDEGTASPTRATRHEAWGGRQTTGRVRSESAVGSETDGHAPSVGLLMQARVEMARAAAGVVRTRAGHPAGTPTRRRCRRKDERFTAKMTVLIENVEHHMEEEEEEWFSKVRAGLGRKRLQALGAEMLEMKKTAPRKPSQPSALKKGLDA